MKIEGKRPRGTAKLRWKDTVRRDLKAWNTREEWATARPANLHRETAAKGENTHTHCRQNKNFILVPDQRITINLLVV